MSDLFEDLNQLDKLLTHYPKGNLYNEINSFSDEQLRVLVRYYLTFLLTKLPPSSRKKMLHISFTMSYGDSHSTFDENYINDILFELRRTQRDSSAIAVEYYWSRPTRQGVAQAQAFSDIEPAYYSPKEIAYMFDAVNEFLIKDRQMEKFFISRIVQQNYLWQFKLIISCYYLICGLWHSPTSYKMEIEIPEESIWL